MKTLIAGEVGSPVEHGDEVNSPKACIKIAYIGGGSREWAAKLMMDLALSERLCGTLALYDIDASAAEANQALAGAVFSHPGSRTHFDVTIVKELDAALEGADFVVISIEPGPIKYRQADLEIPARYGILQTVGDTTGPGGILRAMRSSPIFEDFGRRILRVCPEAWVINYTNPMAVCTASLLRGGPDLKVFGCCHEVFSTQKLLAQKVVEWFGVPKPRREEIQLDIAGVNHFTWATSAHWNGRTLLPLLAESISDEKVFASRESKARERVMAGRWFESDHLVALDLLRRFGALGAAGDRHLVEFLPWYLTGESELYRWGVVETPYEWRLSRLSAPRRTAEEIAGADLEPSGEEGVHQIEAILGLRELTTNINLPNRGQLPCAPRNVIVETYAEFGKNSVRPLLAGALPAGVEALIRRAAEDQQLLLEAIAERSLDRAFQALLASPLVRISTDKARAMFDEMIEATHDMLGEWR